MHDARIPNLGLEKQACKILTDSGGVQPEAWFVAVPCITLRAETEWVETLEGGWNILVGTDPESIVQAIRQSKPPASRPKVFGDGQAAEKMVHLLGQS